MRVPIRLYKRHDLDLICLYKHEKFSLVKAMKVALYGYVHHERFFINTPIDNMPSQEAMMSAMSGIDKDSGKIKDKPIFFNLVLNEEYDQDIIDFIQSMPHGYRNSLIKNIVRSYFYGPNLFGYYIDENQAAKDHKIKNTNGVPYKKLMTYEFYKTVHVETVAINIIDIYRSKSSVKKNRNKKYSTANIPIEELPDAVLEGKIYDQEYLKQFDPKEREADVKSKLPQEDVSKKKKNESHTSKSNKPIKQDIDKEDIPTEVDQIQSKPDPVKEDLPEQNADWEGDEYVGPDQPEDYEDEDDDLDFFENIESMMEKGGF